MATSFSKAFMSGGDALSPTLADRSFICPIRLSIIRISVRCCWSVRLINMAMLLVRDLAGTLLVPLRRTRSRRTGAVKGRRLESVSEPLTARTGVIAGFVPFLFRRRRGLDKKGTSDTFRYGVPV